MRADLPQFYVIRVAGRLDTRWSEWFDGMTIEYRLPPEDETVISGYVPDQASLHGLLNKIRDLNLRLIAVEQRPEDTNPASPAA